MNDTIKIKNENDLNNLIKNLDLDKFAEKFEFMPRDLFYIFLEEVKIDKDIFENKYFYYDSEKSLHIAESEHGYVWISNCGLVGDKRLIYDADTDNNYLRMLNSQSTLLQLILDKMIYLCKGESVYDIDSREFDYINNIAPAFIHNHIFYLELFSKAYLKYNKISFKKTHSLYKLYGLVVDTMFRKNHSDSLFHLNIIRQYKNTVEYIKSMSNDFKEEFIKYDDNINDTTIVFFNELQLYNMVDFINLCEDFMFMLTLDKDECFYIKPGLYKMCIDNKKTDDERKEVMKELQFLVQEELNIIE